MAVLTGRLGHISKGALGGTGETAINCVRDWNISLSAELLEMICSASDGAAISLDGNRDWTGGWGGYGAIPAAWPGDTFEFEGAITGSAGSAVGASGDCIVDSVAITWNQESGAPISHTVNFGGSGELTLGTVTVPADAAVPEPAPSKGCLLKVANDPFSSFASIGTVRTMTLTLTAANKVIHTAAGAGWPERKEGNLTGAVAVTAYADDADGWASLPQPNAVQALQMFSDDTLYYLIRWIRWGDLGDMGANIEGSDMVGGSFSGQFTGFAEVSSTWTKGAITKPVGGDVWS